MGDAGRVRGGGDGAPDGFARGSRDDDGELFGIGFFDMIDLLVC
jgi:hypothetical protein